jgi:NAD(P)-binding Rossmann-like domain
MLSLGRCWKSLIVKLIVFSAMGSPFLHAHEAVKNFFWLSAGLAPISIRDQMVRGVSVIDQLDFEKRIKPGDRVLIVGAGAAGVSAAMRAAKKGFKCDVVDRGRGPFLVQARAATRWVDPTQYDWPMENWRLGLYPWHPPAIPLPWRADWAPLIAAAWHHQFRSLLGSHPGRVKLWFLREVSGIVAPSATSSSSTFDVDVTFVGGRPGFVAIKLEPEVIIWATGFGREDCRDPTHSYAGIPFWAADRLTTLRLRPIPPVVVISGAGDGGLQDYLRVTTGRPSAESIYRYLIAGTGWDARLKPFLRDAEDLAHRWWVWSGSKEFDHEIYSMLQREHTAAANAMLRDPAVLRKLKALFSGVSLRVMLFHGCDHFSNFYPLNRFLVILISRYLLKGGNRTVFPGFTLRQVAPVPGHACNPANPWGCAGFDHDVVVSTTPTCLGGIGGRPYFRIKAQFVIIRHGVDTSTLFPPGPFATAASNLERTRHSVPYHLIS